MPFCSMPENRCKLSGNCRSQRQVRIDQSTAAALTLGGNVAKRLVALTTDRGDRESAQDALSNARAAIELLTEWYETEPADA